MFFDFVWFEIKYRFRQVSTYVYFLLWFLMMFFSVSTTDFGPVGNSKVILNGPFALGMMYSQLSAFGVFVISAIFGTSILRDFRDDTYQLIFTKPVAKLDYLGGRWAGSLIVSIAVFSGMVFGAMAGALMPWADHTRLAPINVWIHLQPFFSLTLIQIFYLGSLFFMVAALSRRVVVVYLQAVILFAIYLIGIVILAATGGLERFWPSVLDPLGIIMFQTITRYWTVVERNSLLVPWSGAFLYNRLLWTGVGVVAMAIAWKLFPMSAEALAGRVGSKKAAKARKQEEDDEEPVRSPERMELKPVTRDFGAAARWIQFVSLTRTRFLNIVREVPAIVLIMIVLSTLNAVMAGRMRETAVWPVTYLMTGVIAGSSSLFLYIVATMYGGELIWRERDVRFDQIHDSLPLADWLNWISQFCALMLVELCLLSLVMLCGIGAQTSNGYYHYELPVYLKELYLVAFPGIVGFAMTVFFWQTILSKKFVAHGVVIGTVLIVPILYKVGVENRLLLVGEQSPYTYSDMNGYGHFVPALLWSTIYWLALFAILALASIALARRGTDLAWSQRLKSAAGRWRALAVPAVVAFAVSAGVGTWFYYNAHVLNKFRTAKEVRHLRADYERAYKKYEHLAQPKITDVDVAVNLLPESRSFDATGVFTLRNTTLQPISDIHITNSEEDIEELKFDRPNETKLADKKLGYWIFHLAQPLAPGDSLHLNFRAAYHAKGFRDGNERNEMAYNGTFFDRNYFPEIGYSSGVEIGDPARRREEKLPLLEELPPPGDPQARNINLFTSDSNWTTFHCIVSTSPDQIAIAPGYLQREWNEKGRRYFEYGMGDTRIANFYSFLTARYAVKRERYKNVNLEIYYYPGHEYNLDRMLQASKKGLDYFEANFSPFQFRQFRVLEFPRYRGFAQSFPNTVPYSEGLGFIQRVRKPEDIDMIFYVTAHELAHQWWGHQLIGSATQGSNMMSETLAQYSALMVMEKEYGPQNIRKFLKHELDAYLGGRGGELRKEPPLTLVQREPYVWYNKGSLVMYALRDYMGEEKLNGALRKFLLDKRYATGPYPDTRDFVSYLREAAPPEMQPVITDMMERIVLFDNKAVTATWSRLPDKRYKVELTLDARKVKADGQGNETELPIDDWIDVGIFAGDKDHPKPLYFQKHHFTGKETKLELIVKDQPTHAGIDPYHKLIDRKPDDNVVDASKM
jgi:hypothetical protein